MAVICVAENVLTTNLVIIRIEGSTTESTHTDNTAGTLRQFFLCVLLFGNLTLSLPHTQMFV